MLLSLTVISIKMIMTQDTNDLQRPYAAMVGFDD